MIYQILGFSEDKSTRFRRDYTNTNIPTNELKDLILYDQDVFIFTREDCKIIYEKYSSLYIVFVIDLEENEFYMLEIMRRFLNLLDCYFKRVCDNHLMYHFDVVHEILDEFILNGKVVENSTDEIMSHIK